MVDTSRKLDQIMQLIEEGAYFTINRPRQYGKSTTMYLLARRLKNSDHYLVLNTSFEGIADKTYHTPGAFIYELLNILIDEFDYLALSDISALIKAQLSEVTTLEALSRLITQIIRRTDKQGKAVVFMIDVCDSGRITPSLRCADAIATDEVDKSSNNQLFLDFLAMLRAKYLKLNT